ncbi:GroES-like protein [Acephala macrosclerotiorum]|nr:GroES-like protein [Acephala macrosclerotiorum]
MPKQLIVQSSIEAIEIIDTPIPIPHDKEVVIKVVVSGTNPKDWKYPLWYAFFALSSSVPQVSVMLTFLHRKNNPHNSGDDIAGIVHSIGKGVYEFKPGDRVVAFHEVETENGSFAEYAVAPDWTTFHLPHNVAFEEAATIPLAALTAAVALYGDMKLPAPYELIKPAEKVPILIYGVTSAVGAFAAKFARLSGLSPIIGVAGRAQDFAKTLADYVVDYRNGEDALVAAVEEVLAKEGLGSKVPNVFDAISENGSIEVALRFLNLA